MVENQLRLIVKGQGLLLVKPLGGFIVEKITIRVDSNSVPSNPALELDIQDKAILYYINHDGTKSELVQSDVGLDGNTESPSRYWLSLDPKNNKIKYGRGEPADKNTSFVYQMNAEIHDDPIVHMVHSAEYWFPYGPLFEQTLTIEDFVMPQPIKILHEDEITMLDVDNNEAITIHNLSEECRRLYGTVGGAKFILETPDFPEFYDAIDYSIKTPGNKCYEMIQKKLRTESFGNDDEVYLRIALGEDRGESPGIPYIMEIWPPGKKSPIHQHSNAYAIIKVLGGAINVLLFSELQVNLKCPYSCSVFKKNDATFITPMLNQTHQLINKGSRVCITIQCYAYPAQDRKHYEYFDYVDDSKKQILHYEPISDEGFSKFRREIHQEWISRNS